MRNFLEVVVDDRERRAQVQGHLRAMSAVRTEVRRLTVGDYQVDGLLLFERKTASDFATSLIEGRLLNQAKRLASSPCRPVIILEGRVTRDATGGIPREALQGAMIAVTLQFGIPVLRSCDEEETARLICYAGRQAKRVAMGNVSRQGYRPRGLRRRKLHVLQGLPGVGPHRAANLLDTLGSLEAVFSAGTDALARVKGIGPGTAEAIRALAGAQGLRI